MAERTKPIDDWYWIRGKRVAPTGAEVWTRLFCSHDLRQARAQANHLRINGLVSFPGSAPFVAYDVQEPPQTYQEELDRVTALHTSLAAYRRALRRPTQGAPLHARHLVRRRAG